jgi:hypothetical protein
MATNRLARSRWLGRPPPGHRDLPQPERPCGSTTPAVRPHQAGRGPPAAAPAGSRCPRTSAGWPLSPARPTPTAGAARAAAARRRQARRGTSRPARPAPCRRQPGRRRWPGRPTAAPPRRPRPAPPPDSPAAGNREAVSRYVRMVKTGSGATAVQIVYSSRRDIKHIGSAHDDAGLELLKAAARQRMAAWPGRA